MNYYRIPTNYSKSGKVFRGMIAKRNLVDAIMLGAFGALLASLLPFEGSSALSGYILISGLFAVIGIIGVHGIPVSVYLMDSLLWLKRRKHPFLYNSHGGAFTVSAADVLLNEPQLRDNLADAIDRMRSAMTPKKPDYIEGETFQFADDPELQILRAAQEDTEEDSGEEAVNEKASFDKANTSTSKNAPAASAQLDVSCIIANIKLDETEGDMSNG